MSACELFVAFFASFNELTPFVMPLCVLSLVVKYLNWFGIRGLDKIALIGKNSKKSIFLRSIEVLYEGIKIDLFLYLVFENKDYFIKVSFKNSNVKKSINIYKVFECCCNIKKTKDEKKVEEQKEEEVIDDVKICVNLKYEINYVIPTKILNTGSLCYWISDRSDDVYSFMGDSMIQLSSTENGGSSWILFEVQFKNVKIDYITPIIKIC